jgi:hypothetical protein
VFAAFREDARGWTVLGDRPLALLGAPDAEAALDEADRSYDAMMRKPGRPRFPPPGFPWVMRRYRLLHEHTGERVVPAVFGAEARTEPGLAPLAGEVLGWSAARLRPAR